MDYFEKINYVTSPEYLDWINNYNFSTHHSIYDDDVQYDKSLSEYDIENALLISYLFSHVSRKEPHGKAYHYSNDKNYFENVIYFVRIRGKVYLLETMWGQGAASFIAPIEKYVYPWTFIKKTAHVYDIENDEWIEMDIRNCKASSD